MNINLPVPQHVDHVYVHALAHSVLVSVGLVVAIAGFVVAFAAMDSRHWRRIVLFGSFAAVGASLVAAFIAYGSATSDAVLTKTKWHDTRLSESSVSSVNGATKNQALNAGLREHYGLVASDPKVAPLQASLSKINTEAAHGTSYTLDGQPVTCALSYSTSHPNNVGMPTKAHIDRVVCAGNNGTHLIKGR